MSRHPRREVKAPRPDDGFFVAVPSYNRPGLIREKTLALLNSQGISHERVFIFVADDEEYARYVASIGADWPNLVVGVPKLWRQRNFITRFFAEGTHVLSMDDDVEELFQCLSIGRLSGGAPAEGPGQLQPIPTGGLNALAEDARCRMMKTGAHMWSLNVSDNPFYMRLNYVDKANGLCNGFFWGCLIRHSEDLVLRFGDGHEDVERTVRHFQKDQAVLRYRFLCAKTRCKTTAGGLQASMPGEERRLEEQRSAEQLVKEFPDLLKLVPDSTLGLKFRRSGTRALINSYGALSLGQLKELSAHRKLQVLQGAVWGAVAEDHPIAALPRIDGELTAQPKSLLALGGIVEHCFHHKLLLRGFERQGKGSTLLEATWSQLAEKIRDGELQIVWLPAAACEALGLSTEDFPVQLRLLLGGGPQVHAAPEDSIQGGLRMADVPPERVHDAAPELAERVQLAPVRRRIRGKTKEDVLAKRQKVEKLAA